MARSLVRFTPMSLPRRSFTARALGSSSAASSVSTSSTLTFGGGVRVAMVSFQKHAGPRLALGRFSWWLECWREMRVPCVEKFVDHGRTEILCIWCHDFTVCPVSHGIQKLFESRVVSQSEKGDLCVKSAHFVEFSHGGVERFRHGRVGEYRFAV